MKVNGGEGLKHNGNGISLNQKRSPPKPKPLRGFGGYFFSNQEYFD
jgi:hypothetical protein